MKRLLVMLVKRLDDRWWEVRWMKGSTPSDVKEGHYIFPVLLEFIRLKLKRTEKDHAEIDPRS